jgi:hypothetical protein
VSNDRTKKRYLRKTYLKTASMLRSAARASAVLNDANNAVVVEAASEYGESLGMAFQIVDDILDFQVGLVVLCLFGLFLCVFVCFVCLFCLVFLVCLFVCFGSDI